MKSYMTIAPDTEVHITRHGSNDIDLSHLVEGIDYYIEEDEYMGPVVRTTFANLMTIPVSMQVHRVGICFRTNVSHKTESFGPNTYYKPKK